MKDIAVLTPGVSARIAPVPGDRLDAVDMLRGIVIVLMALDHTRDFFHSSGINPLDLKTTNVPLFLTRWLTHFCAPTFIFLAGTGAFLSTTRGRTKRDLSWFLVTRGAWLVLLELTFIRWAGWNFSFDNHFVYASVIWAIGWSMIALAVLVHIPVSATAVIALVMIIGHNALDVVTPKDWGSLGWLWRVLHVRGSFEFAPGFSVRVSYPLIPWVGVMAAGYSFGRILTRSRNERRRLVFILGTALTLAFVVLRFTNVYGDGRPWSVEKSAVLTVLSFLNCTKYPPSLCYLLMTLGPALIILALLDRENTPTVLSPLLVFGRVPMFFYLIHIPLIHGLAVLVETIRFGSAPWLFGDVFGPLKRPVAEGAGFNLLIVYIAWCVVVLLLYPICRWFADLKRRRREAWLTYF